MDPPRSSSVAGAPRSSGTSSLLRALAAVSIGLLLTATSCSGGTEAPASASRATVGIESTGAVFGRIPSIVEEVSPSVVALIVDSRRGRSEGSGVIWDADGIIVTNHHVVAAGGSITVAFASGERVRARVRASDALTDLAVLDAERGDVPAAAFAEELPSIGELAVAIGNPLTFENSVTAGIVSGLHRSIPSGGRTPALVDLIQTDAAISPASSGGALVGSDGRVLGINVAFIPPEARAVSIGFAISARTVVDVVRQLIRTGRAEHAFLGVQLAPVTERIAERFDLETEAGAIVLAVVEGSAADEGGVRPGDVITSFDEKPVDQVEDVLAELRAAGPGTEVSLTVLRDGRSRTLTVRLDDRPQQQPGPAEADPGP